MARIPNRLTTQTTSPPINLEQDPDSHSGLADSYAQGWMGQLYKERQIREANRSDRRDLKDPNWNPLDHVPDGYAEYAGAFAGATNPAAIEQVRQNIDSNLNIRARRDQRSFGSNILSDIAAGVADPINIIPFSELKGVGAIAGGLRGAAEIGTVNAATEAVRGTLDATSTSTENLFGVGAGYVLGGAIGTVAGMIGRAADRAARVVPADVRVMQQITRTTESGGRRYAKSGGLTTSPKGAMGEMQVMPGTRSDPGFGVVPARDNSPDELARVGDDYLAALVKRYGDARKAWAAYNWGPGSLDKAIAEHGANWLSAAPKETRDYVAKNVAALAREKPINPGTFVDELEGIYVPSEVDLDGRGIKVVIGDTGTDAPARFVHARTTEQIVAETEALHAADRADDTTLDPLLPHEMTRADIHAAAIKQATDELGAAPTAERTAAQIRKEIIERANDLVAERTPKAQLEILSPNDVLPDSNPANVAAATAERARRSAMRGRSLDLDSATRLDGGESLLERARATDPFVDPRAGASLGERALLLGDSLAARAERLLDNGQPGRANELWRRVRELYAEGARLLAEKTADTRLTDEAGALLDARAAFNARKDADLVGLDAETAIGRREARFSTRDQIRDAMRSTDDNAGDDLPFGVGHQDHLGAEAAEDGEHIVIDLEQLREVYPDKPWANPRVEGITPFGEDSFPTLGDWVSFAFHHELEHTLNPRREGETLVDYENRINQRAWQILQDGKRPFVPDGGRLAKMVIAPTPRGQIARLVPDQTAAIHRFMSEAADDFGVGLLNTSAPGGSVWQRSQRWLVHNFALRQAVREGYLKMLNKGGAGGRLLTEAQLLRQRVPLVGAKSRGEMGFQEFRNAVGAAINGVADDLPKEAHEAATTFVTAMKEFEQAASEVGLFKTHKSIDAQIRRLKMRIDATAKMLSFRRLSNAERGEVQGIIDGWHAKIAELTEQRAKPMMAPREQNYYHRIWNTGAILEDRKGLEEVLTEHFRMTEADPEGLARRTVDNLLQEPNHEMERIVGSPSALKARVLDIQNRAVWKWIVQDPEIVMGIYSRRMGAAIEMTKRYGDPNALDELDTLRADLIQGGGDRQKNEDAMQIAHDMVDRIAGGFHGKDPLSWDNRTARFLKNVGNLAVMGGVIKSQVSDVAHLVSVHGGSNVLKGLVSVMSGELSHLDRGGYAKQAGEAMELVMARVTARIIEHDDALLVQGERGLEKWAARSQPALFTANLMYPFTVMLKELSAVIGGHKLVEDARLITTAIHAGETPPIKQVKRLEALGIDTQDAQLIASMPTEVYGTGLHLVNIGAWAEQGARGERAKDLFLGAMNGETARAVTTPGPLDRPAIFDGVFHNRKGRQEALKKIPPLRQEQEKAAREVARLVRQGMADSDPELVDALERLRDASGELWLARRNVGLKGRRELPLASLPFQMHSFVVASGSKVLHGLLTGRDVSRASSISALLAAGVVATWLKASPSQWENMSWPELGTRAFDNSSLGGWMSDLGKTVDTALGGRMEDMAREAAGLEPHHDWPGNADQFRALGVVPGMAAALIEPFVRNDMGWNEQVGAIRRTLPLQNLIGVKKVFDYAEDHIRTDRGPANTHGMGNVDEGGNVDESTYPIAPEHQLPKPGYDFPELEEGPMLPDQTLQQMIEALPKKTKVKVPRQAAHIYNP